MSLEFQQNYILENDRVILRPLEYADIQRLLPFAENEPDLWTFSLISAAGEQGMNDYVNTAIENRAQGKEYAFSVYDKFTNEIAGSTRFYDINAVHNTTQLGFTWYGKRFQGTGLNKQCKFLMLQFAFETIGFERVEFRADNNNQRSIAAMKSIGCIEEGVLRSNTTKSSGGRRDSIILSILKDEWINYVKERLVRKIDILDK
jgi:N-acetyltransferase